MHRALVGANVIVRTPDGPALFSSFEDTLWCTDERGVIRALLLTMVDDPVESRDREKNVCSEPALVFSKIIINNNYIMIIVKEIP